MGCDIHLHQEVKINGVWHHYREQRVVRNYELFAVMAGVRGESEPVAEPKGLPNDATALTMWDVARWNQDAHTFSWLDAEEIYQVIIRHFIADVWAASEWFGYLFGNSWLGYTQYPEDRPEGLEDIRWIFWFDN